MSDLPDMYAQSARATHPKAEGIYMSAKSLMPS